MTPTVANEFQLALLCQRTHPGNPLRLQAGSIGNQIEGPAREEPLSAYPMVFVAGLQIQDGPLNNCCPKLALGVNVCEIHDTIALSLRSRVLVAWRLNAGPSRGEGDWSRLGR